MTAIGSATPGSLLAAGGRFSLRSFRTGLSTFLKSAASSMAADEKFEMTRTLFSSGLPAESVRAAM